MAYTEDTVCQNIEGEKVVKHDKIKLLLNLCHKNKSKCSVKYVYIIAIISIPIVKILNILNIVI